MDSTYRIGVGYDIHRLKAGRPLWLGGVHIPFDRGLDGHSDADVLLHAIIDALLGAAALPDIGHYFPPGDESIKDIPSSRMLAKAMQEVQRLGYAVVNVDSVVIAEAPKVAPHRTKIRETIAQQLQIPVAAVQLKGKTNEGLDAIGRGEAMAAHAVVLIHKLNDSTGDLKKIAKESAKSAQLMSLKIFNTLTARDEPFEPVQKGEVRMYVCGITPYDTCHLGHARCYVVFDLVRRVLRANGYKVRCVQNFTDVDDKIINRARENGVSTHELVKSNIADYFNKMDALNVERADAYPLVTEHIPDIIALVRKLLDRKAAYLLGEDVYFSVKAFSGYGKLSKRPLDELQSGARIEVNKEKHDPLDFALWKAAKPEDPPEAIWQAPWGKGRPGWHIECSVMALKHLGANFDIHGGGLDLIFPHHENEIAQSETATQSPFARTWMHNGFVTLNREKMSKSLGNFFALSDIFKQYHPSIVRYMLLSVHYRSPLDFSQELLEQSRSTLSSLKRKVSEANRVLQKQTLGVEDTAQPDAEARQSADLLIAEFHETLNDDFNSPGALGVLHQLMTLLEKQFSQNSVSRASVRYVVQKIREASELLGVDVFSSMQEVFVPGQVTELCAARETARQVKNWAEADRLRKAISEAGYVVEDTPDGPRLLPKAGL